MARISGVELPGNKHVCIALQHIFGIGPTRAAILCKETKINPAVKLSQLSEIDLDKIRACLASHAADWIVEGDLRREFQMAVKRLKDIKCYRGLRHLRGLPVRGQRTKTNAKTRKKNRRAGTVKVVTSASASAK